MSTAPSTPPPQSLPAYNMRPNQTPNPPQRPPSAYAEGHPIKDNYSTYPNAAGSGDNTIRQHPAMSSSYRRPLPQPAGTYALDPGIPSNAYPISEMSQANSASSMGSNGRARTLPKLPPVPSGSASQGMDNQGQPSQPRPSVPTRTSQRALPALPPVPGGATLAAQRTASYDYKSHATEGPAPPPRIRPLPTPSYVSQPSLAVSQYAKTSPIPNRMPSIPAISQSRQASLGLGVPSRDINDSPTSMRDSSSGSPGPTYFESQSGPSQPSRHASKIPMSTALSPSPSISISNESSTSGLPSRVSSNSHRSSNDYATGLSSVDELPLGYSSINQIHSGHHAGKLPNANGLGSIPSRSTAFNYDRNQGTPTQTEWQKQIPGSVAPEIRTRLASPSTMGTGDGGIPGTPGIVPMRTLNHQRSFLDRPLQEPSVHFPIPQPNFSPDANSQQRPPEVSRHTSNDSGFTDVSSVPGGGPIDGGGVDAWRRDQSQSSWNQDRQSAVQRQTSMNSSLHPPSRSSFTSNGGRRPTELSPSWAGQTQPPARWVQNKLLLHQSNGRDEDYYDEDGEIDRRRSGYTDAEGNWDGEEDEEEAEEEVNEIRFFNPALLSEVALQLRDRVPKGRYVKAGIAWVGSFTGRDLVVSRPRLSVAQDVPMLIDRQPSNPFFRRIHGKTTLTVVSLSV
jgi:hypothetical protein